MTIDTYRDGYASAFAGERAVNAPTIATVQSADNSRFMAHVLYFWILAFVAIGRLVGTLQIPKRTRPPYNRQFYFMLSISRIFMDPPWRWMTGHFAGSN
jgi:hypothetical protein